MTIYINIYIVIYRIPKFLSLIQCSKVLSVDSKIIQLCSKYGISSPINLRSTLDSLMSSVVS